MKKRNEILERAADRRRFRLGSPQPTKLKPAPKAPDNSLILKTIKQHDRLQRPPKVKPPKIKPARPAKIVKPPKPARIKKVRAPKPKRQPLPREEINRRQAARWFEDRPMPDPTMERCPGSGHLTASGKLGSLLECRTCGQKFGVWPPFELPEHNREKQP